jgi:hypothetical protein
MMTLAAACAARGLAQLISWSIIRGHDVRQLMKTCLFAFTDTHSVVRADLHPALTSVSTTASPAALHGYRVRVRWKRSLEPLHLLDGIDVTCATPVIYYPIVIHQDRAG